MTRKFFVSNHATGVMDEVDTLDEAIVLRDQAKADFLASMASAFQISVGVQLPSGAWVQAAADDQGQPVVAEEAIKALFDAEAAGEPLPVLEEMQPFLTDNQPQSS